MQLLFVEELQHLIVLRQLKVFYIVSSRLHLIGKKYRKYSNIVKYYYNLK